MQIEECKIKANEPLSRGAAMSARITAGIYENFKPVVTQHAIHNGRCPRCRKTAQPRGSSWS